MEKKVLLIQHWELLGLSLAVLETSHPELRKVGFAVKSLDDDWDESRGKEIAEGRALNAYRTGPLRTELMGQDIFEIIQVLNALERCTQACYAKQVNKDGASGYSLAQGRLLAIKYLSLWDVPLGRTMNRELDYGALVLAAWGKKAAYKIFADAQKLEEKSQSFKEAYSGVRSS